MEAWPGQMAREVSQAGKDAGCTREILESRHVFMRKVPLAVYNQINKFQYNNKACWAAKMPPGYFLDSNSGSLNCWAGQNAAKVFFELQLQFPELPGWPRYSLYPSPESSQNPTISQVLCYS